MYLGMKRGRGLRERKQLLNDKGLGLVSRAEVPGALYLVYLIGLSHSFYPSHFSS